MKAIARIAVSIEWVITFVVSYFLLQFGADRMSRVIATRYIEGSLSNVDGWLTSLGAGAFISAFCLIHTTTRFYVAVILALILGISSLQSLSAAEPQSLLVPMLSLALATIVLISRSTSEGTQHPDTQPGINADALVRSR